MGTTLNSVEHLDAPFRSVDEQVFVIPRTGCNDVSTRHLFKVIFILEGDCLHEVDDDGRVAIATGDVFIIPRECRQRYFARTAHGSRRVHALRLVFDPAQLPPLAPGHRRTPVRGDVELDFVFFLRHHLQEVRYLSQGEDAVIHALLMELRQEAEQRRLGYRFRVTSLCRELMVHLVRQLQGVKERAVPDGASRKSRADLVLQSREFLLKNLHADLRLDQVAWNLHVSAEHLARTFKQETGQTVFTYLQRLRLEKAKTYLLGSDQSISAIAALTGFKSVALFSRNFKRYVGASPLEYRRERWNQAAENT